MKSGEIIAFAILALFILATIILCDRQSSELRAIHSRIDLVEAQVGHGNIPRIEVSGRTTIYSANGEIVLEEK